MSQKKPGISHWEAMWIGLQLSTHRSTAKRGCFPLLQPTTLGQLSVALTIHPSFPSLFQHTKNMCAIFLWLLFLYGLCPPFAGILSHSVSTLATHSPGVWIMWLVESLPTEPSL